MTAAPGVLFKVFQKDMTVGEPLVKPGMIIRNRSTDAISRQWEYHKGPNVAWLKI
jgi:hypothetical protein